MMSEKGLEMDAGDRSTTRRARPIRVLVAEDDEATREAVVTALLDDGLDVIGVEDGAQLMECLGIIARDGLRVPDLLLMDVRMPGLSGVELLEDLRRTHLRTPVILMTALSTADLRSRVEEAGLAVLIQKPFGLEDLRAAARRMSGGAVTRSRRPAGERVG